MTTEPVYSVAELTQCDVVTVQGEILGRIRDVLPTGANDIFVVGEGEKEILIPALKGVVIRIDLEAKRIEVDLPEGLRAS